MPQSDRLTLSVSQLNGYVRSLLQADALLRGLQAPDAQAKNF